MGLSRKPARDVKISGKWVLKTVEYIRVSHLIGWAAIEEALQKIERKIARERRKKK